jgi:DNA gyrase/topoisomerase IV subunit A
VCVPVAAVEHRISELQKLLGSRADLLSCVEREAREVADKHGTPRRSVLIAEEVGWG